MKAIKWAGALLFGAPFFAGIATNARAQVTQPMVAIHDSELTRAMEFETASNGTPSGAGTTGNQWWPTDWHYFVMPDSLKEAFRSDGTAYTVVGDSNIAAGALLVNGVPKYPILISLSSEAMSDAEIAPLTNYVAAGGFLFVGGSSFTRKTNGVSRGDFAFANAMGVHMVVPGLTNWGLDTYLTVQTNNRIVNDIPTGTNNTWRMPSYSEEIPWGVSPAHIPIEPHDIWQVTSGGATVLAQGDNSPYILIQPYGKGYFIYDAAFEPLIGHGGFAPGMYTYMIFRRSIEWAFESANLPIPKLSPWPYQYDSAYMVRHDLENYPNEIADLLLSAQIEYTNGAKGDYYFCTGTLRQDMSGDYNTNTVVQSLRTAVQTYGATIGPHNGGLPNPYNSDLFETNGIGSSYDYWHWGPDEVLDTSPAGYSSGTAYAYSSLSLAFSDVESWLHGLESSSMRTWVACYFNGTRENSLSNQAALGVKIAGDQKLTPFPAWTLSTQTPDYRYPTLSEPVSDWFVGGLVAQSLEPWHPPGVYTSAILHSAIDFYYNEGFLINIYSHTLATGEGGAGVLMPDYLTYCANTNLHPRIWPVNGIGVYNWWLARSNAQISVSYNTNGAESVATINVANATDPNMSVELYIPATTSFCSLQVFTNGVVAGSNGYRINGQLVKVLVGRSVTNVIISYYPLGGTVGIFSQNFSGLTPPALPSGWTSSASGVESNWVSESSVVSGAPNAVFVPDVPNIGLSYLVSPPIALPSGQAQLNFMNYYNLETGLSSDGFDGGVLEIKIGSGSFTDILAAGGSFVTGGYTSLIDTNYQNPLAGRQAWSGNSGGFIQTTVNLPASASGQTVQLRWGCGTDNGNAAVGWYIDTISISNRTCACCSSNSPPTLPSQGSISVPELTPVLVTNTATDNSVPANQLTYSLVSPPGGAAISSNGIIAWTPSQTESPGNYTITTVVSDNGQPPLTATNSFTVTVMEVNVAPVLGNISNRTVNELTQLKLTNTATEPNIHSVTTGYGLVNAPAGATINGNGVITWTPQQTQSPGTNVITTVVTNSNPYDLVNPTLTATNSFTVTVKEVNVPPTLGGVANRNVNELTPLTVTNAATESNIHAVTTGYALVNPPAGASISASGVITWTPSQAQSPGTNTFKTVVTNSDPYDLVNPILTATNAFTVTVKEVNVAPTLGAISNQTVSELTTLTVTNAATEANIHSVITGYALVNPPAGASISAGGVITWMPSQTQSPSTNTFKTVVTNSNPYDLVNPTLTATNSFSVVVTEVNVAPALGSISNQTVNELTTLTVTNAATEANIHSVITGYALVNPPAGASISVGGVITWMPSQTQSPGTNFITTVVTNNNPYDLVNPMLTATNSFSVVVTEVNVAPALGSISNQTVNELTTLTVTNAATEANIHSVTTGYALVNPPAGASITASGVITWMPSQNQSPGTNVIMTVVTNNNPYDLVNPTLTTTNSFTVVVMEVNMAPALPAQADGSLDQNTTMVVTNAAMEPNIHSLTTGYSLLNPPTGAGIDIDGVITWTPGLNINPGTNTITTVVANSDPYDSVNPVLTATNSFNVIVTPAVTPPMILSVGVTNQMATVTWTTVPGHTYTLQSDTNLDGVWDNLLPPVVASGATASMTNAVGLAPSGLYQVITSPNQFHRLP